MTYDTETAALKEAWDTRRAFEVALEAAAVATQRADQAESALKTALVEFKRRHRTLIVYVALVCMSLSIIALWGWTS